MTEGQAGQAWRCCRKDVAGVRARPEVRKQERAYAEV